MCRSEETVVDAVRINVSEWRDCCWLSQNKCVGVKRLLFQHSKYN